MLTFSRAMAFVVAFLFVIFHDATAQDTDAVCWTSYEWALNTKKQSPCSVASALLATCGGGSYNVKALPDDTHYLGPTLSEANPCQCNTVIYSLMSACGACQHRSIISWSSWRTNCVNGTVGSFPAQIPAGLRVPGWAYLDVKTGDTFDENLAKQNANSTESTAVPLPPATATAAEIQASTGVSSLLPAQATANSTAAASSATGLDARADLIGGSVVGSILGLALVVSLAYWYRAHRRRLAKKLGVPLPSPIQESPIRYRSESPDMGQTPDMSQYLANTRIPHIASTIPSICTTPPDSPGIYTSFSAANSARSVQPSNV